MNNKKSEKNIKFENLRVGDILLLRTKNNIYQFKIGNLSSWKGLLSGGAFRKISVPAFLCQPFELCKGTQLRFLVESTLDCFYLTTTEITHLEVIKGKDFSLNTVLPTAELPNQTAGFIH